MKINPAIKKEIHEVMGNPCPECGSFNIWVRTRDGTNHPRGSKGYKPEDAEYTFCNMCGNKMT